MKRNSISKTESEEGGWDPEGFRQWLIHHFPVSFEEGYFDKEFMEAEELAKLASDKIVSAFKDKLERENSKFPVPPNASENPAGQNLPMRL